MRLVFTPHGWEDYQHWVQTDRATLKRVNRLVEDVLRDPFTGTASPSNSGTCCPAHGRAESPKNTGSCT